MPIIAHSALPTFARLAAEGCAVLPPERAARQDIRELHIGLLNMMPDAALGATERQFFRLVGDSNQIAQFRLHPFTLPEIPRGRAAAAHIARYYESFADLRAEGLDALIVTGANVTHPELSREAFWGPLQEAMDWAWENVTSTLCSCLATHAVLQFRHGQGRSALPEGKLWGVFPHKVTTPDHPLVRGMNTRFDAPHSRWNQVTAAQFADAGMTVLAAGDVGAHLAVSADGLRTVCLQGHPEYDTVSLLKEYKREVGRYGRGERGDYPPLPEGYVGAEGAPVLEAYRARVHPGATLPPFPEEEAAVALDNTWRDSARTLVGNWIGLVYQVTGMDRRRPFMDGVDPADPLGLRARRPKKNAPGRQK
ncbi:MAG TPA: homoserine O-succinyltransferase [Rhodospirillaceae bacterium]|jgi:homoserine O-succinyltransferase|nr:homoserine O-succinyltransferase [Alphaproteobacteria bacterium]HBH27139.1 homoserine O-succinyltransferase [Rhodospirillaceae bacterium]